MEEEIELEEDNIIHHDGIDVCVNCPECGEEYTEYDIGFEQDYICECEECGHKFKFNYCPF